MQQKLSALAMRDARQSIVSAIFRRLGRMHRQCFADDRNLQRGSSSRGASVHFRQKSPIGGRGGRDRPGVSCPMAKLMVHGGDFAKGDGWFYPRGRFVLRDKNGKPEPLPLARLEVADQASE